MGTWCCSPEEIRDKIEKALDDLEGDFTVKTLKEGLKLAQGLGDTYCATSDRERCEDCEKPFMLTDDDDHVSFKCPHCGHHN